MTVSPQSRYVVYWQGSIKRFGPEFRSCLAMSGARGYRSYSGRTKQVMSSRDSEKSHLARMDLSLRAYIKKSADRTKITRFHVTVTDVQKGWAHKQHAKSRQHARNKPSKSASRQSTSMILTRKISNVVDEHEQFQPVQKCGLRTHSSD